MGLDYLNKKVWHPGSMKNIQKVWEEEQKQKEISKRNKERAKKLQEQRHNEQLKRIQVEAGLIPRSHLDRMEWMYDWGNKIQQQQKTNEEFLTGNKKANSDTRKEFKHVFQEQITNKKCQDFSLLHQDPMFQIQKQQKRRRQALMNNPFQMKQIIKEVQRQYIPKRSEQYKSQKSSKKSKKEKKSKKHSKQKEQRRKSRSYSSSRSKSSSQRSDQRERSRNHRRRHDSSQSPQKTQTNSKKSKQSKLYKQYLKERFGGILKKQEDGSLRPDYGIHKKRYKTQYQLDEQQRKNQLNKLRQNALKLRQYNSQDTKKYQSEQQQQNFEEGVANIRQNMFKQAKQNRNLKKVSHGSDSQ